MQPPNYERGITHASSNPAATGAAARAPRPRQVQIGGRSDVGRARQTDQEGYGIEPAPGRQTQASTSTRATARQTMSLLNTSDSDAIVAISTANRQFH